MARILFFGRLRDVAGTSERIIAGAMPLSAYRAALEESEPELAAALNQKSVRVALNQQLLPAGADPMLNASDEIAFMPAFSGG
jgi:molybdopterin converting factor small subunit